MSVKSSSTLIIALAWIGSLALMLLIYGYAYEDTTLDPRTPDVVKNHVRLVNLGTHSPLVNEVNDVDDSSLRTATTAVETPYSVTVTGLDLVHRTKQHHSNKLAITGVHSETGETCLRQETMALSRLQSFTTDGSDVVRLSTRGITAIASSTGDKPTRSEALVVPSRGLLEHSLPNERATTATGMNERTTKDNWRILLTVDKKTVYQSIDHLGVHVFSHTTQLATERQLPRKIVVRPIKDNQFRIGMYRALLQGLTGIWSNEAALTHLEALEAPAGTPKQWLENLHRQVELTTATNWSGCACQENYRPLGIDALYQVGQEFSRRPDERGPPHQADGFGMTEKQHYACANCRGQRLPMFQTARTDRALRLLAQRILIEEQPTVSSQQACLTQRQNHW